MPRWLIEARKHPASRFYNKEVAMRETRDRVVGVDCAEERHVMVLLDGGGEVGRVVEVENRWEPIGEALGGMLLRVPSGGRLSVVVESQRSHGRLVADCARELGCELMTVSPMVLNRYRQVEGEANKDDLSDAWLLARLGYFGHRGVRDAVEYTPEERELQRLKTLWDELVQDRTRALLRLRSLVLEVIPELLDRKAGLPAVKSAAMLGVLQKWPGLEGLERARRRSIKEVLRQNRFRGDVMAVVDRLRDLAKNIQMAPAERRILTVSMKHQVDRIVQCTEELRELEEALREAVERDPVGVRLLEVPGVGIQTAAVLLGWYRPLAVRRTEGQTASYSGLTPMSRRSGKSAGRDHLRRWTNRRLMHALYLSAIAAIRVSALDRTYYEKKLRDYAGHPKPHVAAALALARQRLKLMYRIIVLGERYDKEKLIARHLERESAKRCSEARRPAGCGAAGPVGNAPPTHPVSHSPLENRPSHPSPLPVSHTSTPPTTTIPIDESEEPTTLDLL